MSSAGSNPDSPLYVTSPVIESGPLSSISGCNVYLKLENLQPGCSFKSRGISNFMKKVRLLLKHQNHCLKYVLLNYELRNSLLMLRLEELYSYTEKNQQKRQGNKNKIK